MIYEITKELRAALKSRGVPFPVLYGPERTQSAAMVAERIVIQRAEDSTGPARSVHRNPKLRGVRLQGVMIRIYARSGLAGAAVHDHERRAEAVLDRVQAVLSLIAAGRRNALEWGAGKFLLPEDLEASETWPGAVYELACSIERGIFDTDWQGEAQPEAPLGGVKNRTDVTAAGAPEGGPVVTACGAAS